MFHRFVALGDSFTEGLHDPDRDGSLLGWADRVAAELARLAAPQRLHYANLAVRGKRLEHVTAEQLPTALEFRPDLVSIAAGGNDILNPRCDVEDLGRRMRQTLQSLAGTGATVVVFTGFRPHRLPLPGLLARRTADYNDTVRDACREIGGVLVDLWHMPLLGDHRVWSEDRLHFNAEGHRRIAAAVLAALGVASDPTWHVLPDPAVEASLLQRRLADLAWLHRYLRPWVVRQVQGRSTGDDAAPKRPALEPVADGEG